MTRDFWMWHMHSGPAGDPKAMSCIQIECDKPWACWRCNQLNSFWASECGRCGQEMKKAEPPAPLTTKEQGDA